VLCLNAKFICEVAETSLFMGSQQLLSLLLIARTFEQYSGIPCISVCYLTLAEDMFGLNNQMKA